MDGGQDDMATIDPIVWGSWVTLPRRIHFPFQPPSIQTRHLRHPPRCRRATLKPMTYKMLISPGLTG